MNRQDKNQWKKELLQGSFGAWIFNCVLWLAILVMRVVGYLDWDVIDAMTWERSPSSIVLELLFPLVIFIFSLIMGIKKYRETNQEK